MERKGHRKEDLYPDLCRLEISSVAPIFLKLTYLQVFMVAFHPIHLDICMEQIFPFLLSGTQFPSWFITSNSYS